MFIEMIGWTANTFFLVAYILVSCGKIDGKGGPFNSMNLAGAVLYGIYAIPKGAIPILFLELFWGSIALAALWRVYKKRGAS